MNFAKLRALGGVLVASFLLLQPSFTLAWNIQNFDADIKLHQDGNIVVTETIVADYTGDPKHGIIRSIPVKYQDKFGNSFSLDFKVEKVTDENSRSWPFEQYFSDGNIKLKIGDPDTFVSGPTTFKISYRVKNALLFFKDHDELYWNVTGTETDVATYKASANVSFEGIQAPTKETLKATCFTGREGSTEQDCDFTIENGKIHFETTNTTGGPALFAYEGLTIVAGFPKGLIQEPSFEEKLWIILRENLGYFIPIPVFILLVNLWYRKGRDPETTKNTIMPIYTPPKDLTPAEIGTLVDEHADMKDITATIIDLAVRGYIQIIEKKEKKLLFDSTEYELKRLKSDIANIPSVLQTSASKASISTPFAKNISAQKVSAHNQKILPVLKPHEQKILNEIFGHSDQVKLSSLQNRFYQNLPAIQELIYNQTVTQGFFPKNPNSVRNTYFLIGGILMALAVFGTVFMAIITSISYGIGLFISGLLFMAFANVMPAKTKKGVDTYYQILGLREYINTAEKDRLQFQEKEQIFEKLLPYAMIFGIAERWTKTFEGIYNTPPSWFSSNDPTFLNNFSTYYFYSHLQNATRSMGSTFQSRPSGSSASGGGSGFSGGFSGGGFGGGGTSSW